MSTPPALYTLTAAQVLELLKANTITVETYAQSLLDRIRDRDDIVKVWAHLDQELVLSRARELDQIPENQRGPLHGMAIGIKDVMNTKGHMPTQYGSPIYEGHQSSFDSSAVGILRAAGALIFGKTTTTEFTIPNSGPPTTNPHDPSRTPGGSSCGSAAAVADMHIPLAVGIQTGGSVIRPAAFCGTFATKPTYNTISTSGQKIVSSTFDTIGFFARSIVDLQLLADVFSLPDDEHPRKVCLGDISVALVKTPMWSYAGPGTIHAMQRTASILQNHGVQVEEVSLPDDFGNADLLTRSQNTIIETETALAFHEEHRLHKADLDVSIRNLVENHSKHADAEKKRREALEKYTHLRTQFDATAAKYSVIIAPSAVDETPVGLGDMGSPVFNTMWTGLHVPVVHIPAFKGMNGMPVGVSLVTGRGRDGHLLRISRVLGEVLMAEGGWQSRASNVDLC